MVIRPTHSIIPMQIVQYCG